MADSPRVRFAPSPTGSLHIGSARTALFNYLYAKATGGTFILRIEDTDEQRSTDESLITIIEGLRWLGLHWDEGPGADAAAGSLTSVGEYGPYFQSQRKERHDAYIARLLETGTVHWVDSEYKSHGLDKEEGDALAFRVPNEGETVVYDKIKGEVRFKNEDLQDFVIVKANGTALYNFAVVCDDLDMKISLVLRGDDHLSNTPKQILLYKALGEKPPAFGHIPLIHDEEGHKISKRKQYQWATHTAWYEQQGFLPAAFVNYLARLCWSDGTDNEFWTLSQLEKKFGLKGINPTPARFDYTKLKWFNGKYIRELFKENHEEYWRLLRPYFVALGWLEATSEPNPNPSLFLADSEQGREPDLDAEIRAEAIGALFHDRLEYFSQIGELAGFFYADPAEYPAEEIAKAHITPKSLELLRDLSADLAALDTWDLFNIETTLRAFTDRVGVKFGEVVHPLRLALTGSTASPGIFEVVQLVGKEATVRRIGAFVALEFLDQT